MKIFYTLMYVFSTSFILYCMDILYSYHNPHFIFHFSNNEFFRKIFPFVLLISLLKSNLMRLGFFILFIMFSLIQYIHFSYYGKNIQGIEFYLFFTNIAETFDTLKSLLNQLSVPTLITISSLVSIIFIDYLLKKYILTFQKTWILLLITLLAMNIYVLTIINIESKELTHFRTKWIYPMENRHSGRNFFISLNYFIFGILPHKLMQHSTTYPILSAPSITTIHPKRTVILLIGESMRYDKLTLKNNSLTPFLQSFKQKNKLFFKKIYAGGTTTKVAFSTLLNRIKYPDSFQQIIDEKNCLFKLASENNFKTYFISSQASYKLKILHNIICPKYINEYINRDQFSNYIQASGYDEDLEKIGHTLKVFNENNFIVLEHRGSHSPYQDKYPKKFDIDDPYNNTVKYTDYTLASLLNHLKQQKNEFFFIYVSDHGELLGEHGKHGHGQFEKEVYEIPLLMFTNSKDIHLQKYFAHIDNHYDLSNYLLMLLGYNTKINIPPKSFFILNTDIDGYSGYEKVYMDKNESIVFLKDKKNDSL